jgi:NADH-quinone oxidoreductase subunit M
MIVTLSSIGLPGFNGFVGEFLILLSAFRTQKVFCVIGGTGIILGAVYMLWMFQRVFFGSLHEKNAHLKDLSLREVLVLIPILIMIVFMGVYPKPFLNSMDVSVRALISQVKKGQEPRSMVAQSLQLSFEKEEPR